MSYLLDYSGDGQMFSVMYPVTHITIDKPLLTISYVQSNLRIIDRTFSNGSELIQFLNWLNYNNETVTA